MEEASKKFLDERMANGIRWSLKKKREEEQE